jgi:rod shape-determining protein MreB
MIKIAIDMGSSTTKIYRADSGNGIVLFEPSCVAVSGPEREVVAVGKEAKKLYGKTVARTSIVFPVFEGEIVDGRLAAEMLKAFLGKVGVKASALRRAQVVFALPCGASPEQREDYALVAEECGLKKVAFVEAPFLAALGSGVALNEANPVFCLDIGGGVTNAAVLSLGGIIAGISMNVGGGNIDAEIIDKIEKTKGLMVGYLTAERIKNDIGSLAQGCRASTVAEGISKDTRLPTSVAVCATDIEDCIRAYIDKVTDYAKYVLNKLPAEVAAAVNQNGVCITGGVSKIDGVPEYILKRLDMRRFHLCEEPQYAIATGGGAVVRDSALFDRFFNA